MSPACGKNRKTKIVADKSEKESLGRRSYMEIFTAVASRAALRGLSTAVPLGGMPAGKITPAKKRGEPKPASVLKRIW
jgi:hypothetical protein